MKIEEAIKVLENETASCSEKIIYDAKEREEAFNMAVDALKEKMATEKNDPLTMEDLKQLETGPIYVVPLDLQLVKNGWKEWCVWWAKDEQAMVPGIEYTSWHLADYGTKWIAYRQEPKEENHG